MALTVQQKNFIRDGVRDSTNNLALCALAGTGKTTTLVKACDAIPSSQKILALAFNKSIADELQSRMPPHAKAMTMNSLGHRAWQRMVGNKITLDSNKIGKYLRSLCAENPDLWSYWSDITTIISKARLHGLIPAGAQGEHTALMTDTDANWDALRDEYGLFSKGKVMDYGLFRKILLHSIDRAFEGVIDFEDQIYMCQPPGTKVWVSNKKDQGFTEVPIEYLQEGMEVISYNRRISKLTGFYNHGSVLDEVQKLSYSGDMYAIKTPNHNTQATATHKWLVRMSIEPIWTVYLLRKGTSWKVGQTKLMRERSSTNRNLKYGASPALGVYLRAATEQADEAWILATASSLKEAKILESYISARFGISQHQFSDPELGAKVHVLLGDNNAKAHETLKFFGRDPSHPMWPSKQKRGFNDPCIIESCNLFPEFMTLPEASGDTVSWQKFTLSKSHYVGYVYALKVHRHHLYVADGILTHNCTLWDVPTDKFDVILCDEAQDLSDIQHRFLEKMMHENTRLIIVGDSFQSIYSFRGSTSNSLGKLIKEFDCISYPLTVSFRCAKSIIREAQKDVPLIEAREDAPEGAVQRLDKWSAESIEKKSVILCRNVAPLVRCTYRLIAAGKPAVMAGRDIGKGLITLVNNLIKPAKVISSAKFVEILEEWKEIEVHLARTQGKPYKEESVMDKYESIIAVHSYSRSKDTEELCRNIDELFAVSAESKIELSTIHRAKGREWESVYILDDWRIPSKYAKQAKKDNAKNWEEQMQQEYNLRYVAVTRAKENLFYIESDKYESKVPEPVIPELMAIEDAEDE